MNLLPAPDGFCCRCGAVLPVDVYIAAALRCFVCEKDEECENDETAD